MFQVVFEMKKKQIEQVKQQQENKVGNFFRETLVVVNIFNTHFSLFFHSDRKANFVLVQIHGNLTIFGLKILRKYGIILKRPWKLLFE